MDSKFTRGWTATILVIALCMHRCSGQPQCNATDSNALLQFREAFTDPGNIFLTWQPGTNCCSWLGVNCSSSGRVEELYVRGIFPSRGPTPERNPSYNGVVGGSLGDLTDIVSLKMESILFNGPLPDTFGKLKKLEILSFTFNNLSGSVPASIGQATSLTSLILNLNGPNQPVGLVPAPIPSSYCNLVKLRTLDLSFGVTGEIPQCFCRFTRLTVFNLNSNNLEGGIPHCISQKIPNLELLDLGSNKLTRSIPPVLGGLVRLRTLCLDQNKLSGSIPREFGNLVNLEELRLDNNSLSGPIPQSFGRLTKLRFLDLSFNFLTRITPELGKLVQLTNLLLNSNKLQGRFPPEVANAGSQNYGLFFDVSDNLLSGPIPNAFASAKFSFFLARNNFFSGGFPLSLATSSFIDLTNNFLDDSRQVGTLPPATTISQFSLRNNRFSGPSPNWLLDLYAANSQDLSVFDISGNKFSGPFPASFLTVETYRLETFNASYNIFVGQLPTQSISVPLFFGLDLSHNKISGPIPPTFFASLIPDARYLDLSFNNLSGPLPANSGDFQNLVYLNLSDNQLNGTVPDSVENISTLVYLDLSNNLFTGRVPSKRPPPGTAI